MGFLKFLFVFIVAFYAIRLLLRFLLPIALRKMAEKVMQNPKGREYRTFQRGFHHQNRESNHSKKDKKGKVNVDYIPPKEDSDRRNPEAGEYVEFEELS